MENVMKTEEDPVEAGSVPLTVPDTGSLSCKPLDPKDDAPPPAQVSTQSVPSLFCFYSGFPGFIASAR